MNVSRLKESQCCYLLLKTIIPIPKIRGLLDRLNGAKYFFALVLKDSYHQTPIAKEDQVKTAFTWRGIRHMFQMAPFGLKTLTSCLQRTMTDLLGDLEDFLQYSFGGKDTTVSNPQD